MSDAAAPPESARAQGIFSDSPVETRIDALEAFLRLLIARGAINLTVDQISGAQDAVRAVSALRDSSLGHELDRLLAESKPIAERRDS